MPRTQMAMVSSTTQAHLITHALEHKYALTDRIASSAPKHALSCVHERTGGGQVAFASASLGGLGRSRICLDAAARRRGRSSRQGIP